jgi:hypothetical protein
LGPPLLEDPELAPLEDPELAPLEAPPLDAPLEPLLGCAAPSVPASDNTGPESEAQAYRGVPIATRQKKAVLIMLIAQDLQKARRQQLVTRTQVSIGLWLVEPQAWLHKSRDYGMTSRNN